VTILTKSAWQEEQKAYRDRVRPWVEKHLERRSRGEKHPVYDFLFEYYSFRPAHLLRWSPGVHVALEGATAEDIGWSEFEAVGSETSLVLRADRFSRQRISYLEWAAAHLKATMSREPAFACFGLHEWAMVYRDPNIRHPSVPLRLSRDEIDLFVASQSLRCTHYDAFRFFTPAAAPANRYPLTRQVASDHEQPGCVHANMDLYRFAYKIAPFGPSGQMVEAFELALRAREIDMRASPYDLRDYGFEPICIETREGREEYVEHQQAITAQAEPIRQRMLAVYRVLLEEVTQ